MESKSNPIPFEFDSHSVRVIDHEGEVWFVASDVCAAMGLPDTHKAVNRLDEDEKGRNRIPTPGGLQQMTIISEPGLYRLALTSRKAAAKRFTRWVTHEVLPAIRKTGQYQAPQAQATLALADPETDHFRTNLNALITHIQYIEKYWRQDIGPAVAVLNPSVHGIFEGHLATTKALNQRLINRL